MLAIAAVGGVAGPASAQQAPEAQQDPPADADRDDARAEPPEAGEQRQAGEGGASAADERDHIDVVVPARPETPEPKSAGPDPGARPRPARSPRTHSRGRTTGAESGPPAERAGAPDESERLTFYGELGGAYRFRLNAISDIALTPLERADIPPRLAQNWWGEQWLRIKGEIGVRPEVRLVGELDVLDGLLLGEHTRGVGAAEHARDDVTSFQSQGVQPRKLYLEWRSPLGLVRGGLMGSQWGLGILANDGSEQPPFGDYRYGDRVIRLAFATKPLGEESPFVTAVAGDLVFDDLIADIRDDQRAWQAIVAAFYEEEERTVGLYGVYRNQTEPFRDPIGHTNVESELEIWVLDLYARWDWTDPGGGRIFAAAEGAWVFGETTLPRTLDRERFDVRQTLAAGQLGHESDELEIVFEGGYASGDSNALDGEQRRGTFDPDHRVGLILFPELLAWQTARSATLARAEELFARPPPGSELIPTNGAVAGAYYVFPYVIWTPLRWLDARAGAVWARASSDVADPYRQRAHSDSASYRGGDARNRDLGLELDGALRLKHELSRGVTLSGGIEGGIVLPGGAFDDAEGGAMDPIGMVRLRTGLKF